MELSQGPTRRARLFVVGLILGLYTLVVTSVTGAQEAPVGLGTAESFVVLSGAGVTNTGPTVINGNLGACPTPAVTGFPPGVVNGMVHAGDAVCLQAQSDVTTAYNDAAGRAPTVTYPAVKDLGGLRLTPGVYRADAFAITGTLTLDAQGDPNAVWIFQAGSTLITAPNSRVELINGAEPCNVFWQVGSSATLGVGSTFVGTILALTSITANTNAIVQGRLLARNGAVTLDSNTVTRPVCAPTPSSTSSTATSSTATSSTTTPSTTTVPPTTIPPITVPPITVPPITVAPTTIPPITVPPITVPPITVAPTTIPPITVPPITIPPITIPPITVPPITVPPITVPPITVAPTTVPPITVPPTTTSTSTTLPETTTSTSVTTTLPDTTTIGGSDTGGVTDTGATTTTKSSTTTTSPLTTTATTSTTVGPTTGTSTISTAPRATTTTFASGGVTTAGGAGAGRLARTGSSVRWGQFWGGMALAVGGVMVLLAKQEISVRRRQGSDGV